MESALPFLMGPLVFAALYCGIPLSGTPRGRGGARVTVRSIAGRVAESLPERLGSSERIGRLAALLPSLPFVRGKGLEACGRRELIGLLLLGAVESSVLGGVLSLSPFGALVGAAAPFAALSVLEARERRSRARRVETAMPEAFTALAMSLGSGHSLAQGMRFVGSHAEEPIRSEFLQVSYAATCGIPVTEALDEMLSRFDAPGLDLVALALTVSRRTGAPLKELLGEAANMVGERIELRRLLDVKTSQARMSARMVAAMPCAMVAILSLLSSDFRQGLATVTGAVSVAIALVLNALAWTIIRRIMRVEL